MNKVFRLLFTSTALLLLHSYTMAQKNTDGGPCSYETTNYPATIILIYPVVDSLTSDMIVAVRTLEGNDTITFSAEAHRFIANEELKEKDLKVGDAITYQHKQIISGSCSPDIWFLTSERYVE